ncbi:methyl-CpG-binding domain-containing protein 7-like [Gastrolobium bilobum]|uniref:methyl-CpG-binding domain-containing protein 7-like n=1 Tax=Gastrolobium bilobum TaxID=150636 RepID=UPI002AB11443|nr:methyl-CpG-binding domain-containing protein 7-like [Gastrolobium bilobum]
MSWESLMPTPIQVRSPDIDEYDDSVKEKQLNHNPTSSMENELQIVSLSPSPSSSPFKLPDDWIVEAKPRHSNPYHVDRYYYEPGTGRRFRSLVSVQRYLTQETRDYVTTERKKSENENTTYIDSGTRFRSLSAVEEYLTGENACADTFESVVKSGTAKQSARGGVKSCQRPVKKHSSVAKEDKITLKSKKSDSPKKMNSRKDNRASMHNLSEPPTKVSWVLSGPGGFWSPFVDDSMVPESEKLKWSEAFVLSINDGVINGLNS